MSEQNAIYQRISAPDPEFSRIKVLSSLSDVEDGMEVAGFERVGDFPTEGQMHTLVFRDLDTSKLWGVMYQYNSWDDTDINLYAGSVAEMEPVLKVTYRRKR